MIPSINYSRAAEQYKMKTFNGYEGTWGLFWEWMTDERIKDLSKDDKKGSWRLYVWTITQDSNDPAKLKQIREKFNKLHLQDVDEIISSYPMKGDKHIMMLLKKKGKPDAKK